MRGLATVLAICAVLPAAVPAESPSSTHAVPVEVADPRAFGHVLGDVLERRITVEVPRGMRLQPDSLPRPGARTAWLTVVDATVEARRWPWSSASSVRVRYQVSNAPTSVRRIALPDLRLRFRDGEHTMEVPVDGGFVTVGPIVPAGARADATPLRPDRRPARMSTSSALVVVAVSLALAASLVIGLMSGSALARYDGPFARACRVVRRARRKRDSAQVWQEALRAVHRALDETAQRRVFADDLDGFLADRPRFADLRGEIERFLQRSRAAFFGDAPGHEPGELDWLLDFCRRCRARERAR